ncbi:MAG: hypothetical protein LBC80_00695 [Treponema sp.]|nr:hypothetical protein [Treponema sp.]
MKYNNIIFKTLITLITMLTITSCVGMGGANISSVANDISYDVGTLRNVQKISDDGFAKAWLTVTKDGASLLYNEITVERIPGRRGRENIIDLTHTSRVIFLRNAQNFIKTPTSVVLEDSHRLVAGTDVIIAPEVRWIPKGMDIETAVRIHNDRWFNFFNKIPGVGVFNDDGINFIYSEAERGARQLVRANVNTTAKTFITQRAVGGEDGIPSIRDGIIVFQTTVNNQNQLFLIREDGLTMSRSSRRADGSVMTENATQINLGSGMHPSWHPTEDKIVFIMNGNIMEMNTNDTQQTQIYGISSRERQEGLVCLLPNYTADGRHVLFLKGVMVPVGQGRQQQSVTRTHLFAMNVDGSNVTELTNGNFNILHYSVADDNQIFFISDVGGVTEIWSATINL